MREDQSDADNAAETRFTVVVSANPNGHNAIRHSNHLRVTSALFERAHGPEHSLPKEIHLRISSGSAIVLTTCSTEQSEWSEGISAILRIIQSARNDQTENPMDSTSDEMRSINGPLGACNEQRQFPNRADKFCSLKPQNPSCRVVAIVSNLAHHPNGMAPASRFDPSHFGRRAERQPDSQCHASGAHCRQPPFQRERIFRGSRRGIGPDNRSRAGSRHQGHSPPGRLDGVRLEY